jgi:hypothetical protein
MQKTFGQGFYRTSYGTESAFTMVDNESRNTADPDFDQSMRETKMSFFFNANETNRPNLTTNNFFKTSDSRTELDMCSEDVDSASGLT